MATNSQARRAAPTSKPRQIAAARSCEAFAAGEAPHAIRLWRAGWNATDKGDVNFTPRSAQLVMADYARRGNPLVFDYEHESLLPLEKRGGAPMKGIASATSAEPFCPLDANGQPELWARNIDWTPEAKRQIGPAAERRQISPVCDFDTATGEVLNLKNVALCREGATHSGTLLASVAKGTNMDELIQAICDAAAAGDFEKVESLAQQAEQAGGTGGNVAKMARGMAKPPTPPPAAVAAPPAAPAAHVPPAPPAHAPPPAMAAYSRELAAVDGKADAAMKEVRVLRVESLIAASRDCFDAADEREHIDAANPEATKRHIASMSRKLGTGTLAASRGTTDARPPKDGRVEDPTLGLNASEIQMVHNMNGGKGETLPDGKGGTKPNPSFITLADFAASKGRAESIAASRSGKAS